MKHRRRKHRHTKGLPKGAYRLPNGNYVTSSVGGLTRRGSRLRVTAVHRAEPDAEQVAKALIAIVIERARAEQQPHDRADH